MVDRYNVHVIRNIVSLIKTHRTCTYYTVHAEVLAFKEKWLCSIVSKIVHSETKTINDFGTARLTRKLQPHKWCMIYFVTVHQLNMQGMQKGTCYKTNMCLD